MMDRKKGCTEGAQAEESEASGFVESMVAILSMGRQQTQVHLEPN